MLKVLSKIEGQYKLFGGPDPRPPPVAASLYSKIVFAG